MPSALDLSRVPQFLREGEEEMRKAREARAAPEIQARIAARLAMLSVETGRYADAMVWAVTLLNVTERFRNPGLRVSTLSFIAALYNDVHQHEAAVRALREVLALQPERPEAWFNLANALGDLKRPVEALEAARKAVALRPGSGAYRVRLGALLWDCESAAAGRAEIRIGAWMLDEAGLTTRFDRMWRWIAARMLEDAEAVARVEPLLFPKDTIH